MLSALTAEKNKVHDKGFRRNHSPSQIQATQRQPDRAAARGGGLRDRIGGLHGSVGNQSVLRMLNSSADGAADRDCGRGGRGLPASWNGQLNRTDGAQKDDPGGNGPATGGTTPAGSGGGASAGGKTVDVYGINLPGANRTVYDDVSKANAAWGTCGVTINVVGGESWNTDVLDQQAPTGSLNEYSSMTSPTAEETAMLANKPPVDAIAVYNVPAMSNNSRGENFRPSKNPSVPKAVVVSDSAVADTFAHELGHILLDDSSHHTDPDNLMASGSIRNVGVDKLDASQCAKV
jgi:hypothetical protein